MILFTCCLVLVMLYAAVVTLACVGWLIPEPTPAGKREMDITVVVPFRNEEKNLPRLLRSLAAQQVPLHIILVDDHSTDASQQVIRAFDPGDHLKITVLTNEGEGKKAASATGLKAVITSYVFFTDADCVLATNKYEMQIQNTTTNGTNHTNADADFTDDTDQETLFARSAPDSYRDLRDAHDIDFFSEISGGHVDFFYGPVVYGFNGERTNAVFFLDQLALNSISLGLGKVGIHTYCSGANMGGRVSFLQTAIPDLEKSSNLSGDDVTYLQKAVAQKQKIRALTSRGLMIRTAAPVGLGEFLRQRLRWGQKASGYRGLTLPALSVLVWAVSCLSLIALIGCLSGFLPPHWWAIPFIRLCIDLLFLFLVALKLRVSRYLWAFLPAWLLNLMYIPVLAILGLFANMTWKDRKVKRYN